MHRPSKHDVEDTHDQQAEGIVERRERQHLGRDEAATRGNGEDAANQALQAEVGQQDNRAEEDRKDPQEDTEEHVNQPRNVHEIRICRPEGTPGPARRRDEHLGVQHVGDVPGATCFL